MINQNAIDIATQFLKKVESCKLVPYFDNAGVLTNGYGNTNRVSHNAITQEQADSDLTLNIHKAVALLEVVIKPTEFQFYLDHELAALISFVFNCGCNSSWNIWKLVNSGKVTEIPNELMRFDHIRKNGKLVVCPGLQNRRKAEVELFNTADINNTISNINETEIAPNTLKVVPAPKPNLIQANSNGMKIFTAVSAISVVAGAGHKFGLSPIMLNILVGIMLGCLFILGIAIFLYLRHPKLSKTQVVNVVKWNITPIQMDDNQMAASQAVTTALENLTSAYEAKVAAAGQAASTQAQTQIEQLQAQVTDLQNQLNAANQTIADDASAVAAATPQ